MRERRVIRIDLVTGQVTERVEQLGDAGLPERIAELKASVPDGDTGDRVLAVLCNGCGLSADLDFGDPQLPEGWTTGGAGEFCPGCGDRQVPEMPPDAHGGYIDGDLFFGRDGAPVDALTCARLHADDEYVIVDRHWVRGWMISTVWLGIDHSFGGPVPIIFETMIFPPGDELEPGEVYMSERYRDRYPTEMAARAGHDRALSALREMLGPDALAGSLPPDAEWDGTISGGGDQPAGGGDSAT